MADVAGVAIEATVVRAAIRRDGKFAVAEVPFDPDAPDAAVEALRLKLGPVRAIALSVGLAFLDVAEPDLPPLGAIEQRRVLLRDTDRYFATEGSVAVQAPDSSRLAYATPAAQLQRWVRALERWAPVRAIVSAPVAIASGVAVVHRAASDGARLLLVDAASGETGFVRLRDGVVAEVRRVPDAMKSVLPAESQQIDTLHLPGADGRYAAATGAIAMLGSPTGTMMLDSTLESSFNARDTRRQLASYAAFAIAVIALLLSIDGRRDRTLRDTRMLADSLAAIAEPGRRAGVRVAQAEREARVLSARTATADPLAVMALLSQQLPGDAFVERINWDGTEWRIDGSSNQAAAVVPSIAAGPQFADVRVLTASTRFRDGTRMRESFSIAFKVKGGSVAAR